MTERQKIAILGGGLGGLAAAFELTSAPDWHERYAITIYQKGWRLGGKGASGRGEHQRIEEHGLHCFWGFYDNAFSMLRTAYDELDRTTGPIRTLEDAFRKLPSVWFIEEINGEVRSYEMHFPESSEPPGGGPATTEMDPGELFARYIGQVQRALHEHDDVGAHFRDRLEGFVLDALDAALSRLARAARTCLSAIDERLRREALGMLVRLVGAPPKREDVRTDDDYRRYVVAQALRFAFVVVVGFLKEGIPASLEAFDALDDRDLRAWLAAHGADAELLESPIVRGLYNASFCYPDGDPRNGDLAAGVSLRAVLLMGFSYKGSFMWKMNGGMGDVVFAPLYEALKKRGEQADRRRGDAGSLSFAFFHEVTSLSLSTDGRAVEAIDVDVQARVRGGAAYEPLVDVAGLPSWPARPLDAQLEGADALRGHDLESDWCELPPAQTRRLVLGRDFDHVVLAIPVGALGRICAPLVAASPAWRAMVDGVKTIRTMSFQVWVTKTPEQTAWQTRMRVMTDVYTDPFNSIADMYQTLPREQWPAESAPGGVLYFSCAMPDDAAEPHAPNDAYPAAQDAVVEQKARAWLAQHKKGIMGWLGDGWDESAFASWFFRANINHDERYVLSVAGSTAHRLAPDGSGFDNLYLAGDWTRSPLNLGCAENATMSGLAAGRAVARAADAHPLAPVRPAEPAFVEYPGMPVYPPPYVQRGISLVQLAVEADRAAMQATVDRLLNVDPAAPPFRVLGRWALVQTGFIASNASAPPGDRYGTASETSATILVPVARWQGFGQPGARPLAFGFFAPFVFVDQWLSLVAGREVLGLAKSVAVFDPPGSASTLDDVTVSTMVVDPLGQGPITTAPILRVCRAQHGAPEELADFTFPFRAALAHVDEAPLAEAASLRAAGGALLDGAVVRFFALRQLRGAVDPSRAAFREVTTSAMRPRGVTLDKPACGHTVEIVPHASHPIAACFGLGQGPLVPVAEAFVRIDEAILDREAGSG